MKIKKYIYLILVFAAMQSCSYQKREILFKTEKEIETSKEEPIVIVNPQEYDVQHTVAENDVLVVRLLNEEGSKSSYEKLLASREDATFTVHGGALTLPTIGDVEVIGLTRQEVIVKLREAYAQHIIDPIVDVECVSLTVNVLGEVTRPGKYNFTEGMNLIDGLGLAGGFSPYGIFKNVKIIRGNAENQEIITVDITSIKSLNHEKLTLMNNDIIYVEPRKVKQFDTAVRPYLFLTSLVSSAVALFIVIIRSQ